MDPLLRATPLLDLGHPSITALVTDRGWQDLDAYDAIRVAHDYVRDELAFGYNATDDLPASAVIADGYGQCNTKATVLMALLRRLGVRCRIHGFTIDKVLQKGAITGVAYQLAPRDILHSWVEAELDGRWVNLEGFILDRAYLTAVQERFADDDGPFCGYGVAIGDLADPPVAFDGGDTYIQVDGINADLGVHDDPDDFYAAFGTNLGPARSWLYRNVIRHRMNANVQRLRGRSCSAARRPSLGSYA